VRPVHKTTIRLNVNGKEFAVEAAPDQSLVDLLRGELKLTGTKKGCNSGECGSCTVLLDGEPVASCILPAAKAQGKKIITVEGLGTVHELHPLQKAFLVKGAVQCGFCTPGMLLSTRALLDKNPDPTAEEIKTAIAGNLCRCTGYKKIVEAVQAAAAELRGEKPVLMPEVNDNPVGAPVIRVDGVPKVTGEAKYADDYSFPNMLFAKVLFSAHPHALIKKINTEKARALPGVAGVYTAADIPGPNRCGALPQIKDQPVLADDKVRHYGDAVAVVAAESLEIAEQAVRLIEVDYEPLPGVFSVEDALRPDAPKVHAQGNLLLHRKIYKGDVEKGFAEADAVVEGRFKTPMNEHAYIEPESGVGVYEGGVVKIYAVSQGVHHHRAEIAANLLLPISKVRVIQTVTGGGFGGKIDNSVHVLVALLTWRTGRPVKLTYSREESIIASTKRHPFTMYYKLGAKKDGRLVAARVEIYGDTGAYSSFGPAVLTRTATCSVGPYEVPNAKIDAYAVYTNNPVAGAMRAFGSPQAQIAYESLMDELAGALGISSLEIRRLNAYKEGSATVTGQVLTDGVGLLEAINRVVEKSGYDR
jgi:CO/xanthine dehydrogenase Mo-binding subunit/aerobic-type carbon monoxide dehydrogenase small subunit (CoxS/CutS family)